MNARDLILKHGDTTLMHIYDPAEYDPQKAHDYYERNKHLKGRKAGTKPVPSSRRTARTAVLLGKHGSKKVQPKAKKSRAEIEAKVVSLQAKLDKLKKILSELVRQAKERAGVDTSKQTTSANLTKSTKGSKDSTSSRLTPQQRKEAAQRSQEWRDKHTTPEQKAAALEEQIAQVTQKIKDLRAEAAAANNKKPQDSKPDANKSTKPVPRRGRS